MMGASGCLEARPNEDRAPLMHRVCMVLEWTLGLKGLASTSQGNMGNSEPPDILYETRACIIHTINLLQLHVPLLLRSGYPAGTGIRKSCVRKPVRYRHAKIGQPVGNLAGRTHYSDLPSEFT